MNDTAEPPQPPHPLRLGDIMTTGLQRLPLGATLAEAAAAMANARVSSVVVEQHGEPVGILTERDLLRLASESTAPSTGVGELMSRPLYTAAADTPFDVAWARMTVEGLRHLLVTDAQGHIVGLASETDFRNHLDNTLLQRMGGLLDVMQRDLPQLPPCARVSEALRLMQDRRDSYVVVVHEGRATGVMTERDVPRLVTHHTVEALRDMPLSQVALSPVHAVDENAWLGEAALRMRQLGVRHLAVENSQGLLVGMLLSHDLMNALGQQLWQNQVQAERRSLQSRTRMAEERLNLAAHAAQLGFWDYDAVTNRIEYSKHMLRLMGGANPPLDLGIGGFLARVHPDQADQVAQRVRATLDPEGDGLLDVAYQVVGLDGRWRWVQTRGRVTQRDPQGRPLRAMGVTMDIQERKSQQAELAQALEQLRERQQALEQLSHTVNRSPVVAMTWALEPGWPVTFVSDNISQWGYSAEDMRAGRHPYETLIHPEDHDRVAGEVRAYLQGGVDSYDQNYRLRTADGRWLWLEDHTWLERDSTGRVVRVHGVLTDVSVRTHLEASAAVERATLERMAEDAELPDVLGTLVQGYENLLHETTGSVLLLDDTRRTLHEGTPSRLPAAFREAVQATPIGPAVGACGTSAFTGQAVISADIATDPHWTAVKDLALAHGLQACWSVPIKGRQGRVLGTFAMYHPTPRSPEPHEMEAVQRGAHLAGLAIEKARNEQSLRQLSLAVEQSPNSIVITNLAAEIEYANQAFFAITGYSPDEVQGQNPRILQSGKTPNDTYTDLWDHLCRGRAWKGEFTNRRKNGSEYVESVRISPVQQANGQITHYLAIKEDITRQKLAEQQIHRLAYFDALTGLPNRQLLTDRFQQAVRMAERQQEPLTVMFIDLDHFKNINDTLGHRAGDALLVETARRLEALVRAGDTLSRQGGDEFVLVLPGCGATQAAQVAEKLIEVNTGGLQIDGHDVVVTLSVGIAVYPADGTDFDTLSKEADVAMYRAKEEGRNTYRFFTPEMQTRSTRTLMLENHLRHALERRELMLVYQPQVSLGEGRLVGVEALLRWQHPTLGTVSPAEFIPLAEASGQILPIGEWVLRTAAAQLKTWMDTGLGTLVMAVNLSAVQFRHAGLAQMVARVLSDTGLPPGCLELELTESVAMNDPLGAVVAMDEIDALGVAMSIDDFGTGYSSLSYLKRFKVGKLKIDKSFVQDITTDPDDKAIASAIIGLASSLGLRTIAEGVETPGQLAWLRMQGCDEAQGYFFSPPLSADGFMAWVRQQPDMAVGA